MQVKDRREKMIREREREGERKKTDAAGNDLKDDNFVNRGTKPKDLCVKQMMTRMPFFFCYNILLCLLIRQKGAEMNKETWESEVGECGLFWW